MDIIINTCSRPYYLWATLQSLAASDLSGVDRVRIIDDSPDQHAFLYSDGPVAMKYTWPHWLIRSINQTLPSDFTVPGLGGVGITQVEHMGGFNCRRWVMDQYRGQTFVMLEDDLLFKSDWLQQMVAYPHQLVCGGDLHRPKVPPEKRYYRTAQANLFRPGIINPPFFISKETDGFDVWLHSMNWPLHHNVQPAVVQHIGIQSIIRPKRKANQRNRRITSAKPPFTHGGDYVAMLKDHNT